MCSRRLVWFCLILLSAFAAPAEDANAQDVAIAAQFEAAGNFHKGVAPASVDKRWGLIDRRGTWALQPRYSSIGIGGDGLFPAQLDNKWGYLNAKGELAIPAKFEAAEPFENGVAAVKADGRWGYLRSNGSMETEPTFLDLGGREGAYVCARDAEGWAVFKLLASGPPKREAFDSEVQRAYSVSEGSIIAKFTDSEALYLIDTSDTSEPDSFHLDKRFPNWKEAPLKLTSILRTSEGFAPAATAANKWGYLHKASGEYLWRGRFEGAMGFAQGLAPVKIDGKWGYIDRSGRVVLKPVYDAAFPFRGIYAVVRQGEKRGFLRIDPQGGISVFIAPQYEDANRFTEGLAPVKTGGRWGYVSDGKPWVDLSEGGIVDLKPR